jgi:hypothetical protein
MELLDHQQRPVRLTPGRLALAVVVVASFGVWAYALSGLAYRPLPDLLDDPAFAAAAEPRCAAARAELATLEPAYLAADHRTRAATVRQANAILGSMVADLRAMVGGSDRDRQILGAWLDDWETFLADRAWYADRLWDDPMARFYQSDVANELLDRRITRLARTNDMPSCGDPGDVG